MSITEPLSRPCNSIGAKVHKATRHSFIVNVGDLLFYLRPQALDTHPLWPEVALKVFQAEAVTVDANKRHETTIRVCTRHDAELVEQLFLRPFSRPNGRG